MDNKTVLAFLAGVTVGSIAAWKLLKNKYEQIANDEIESVKESFMRNHSDVESYEEEYELIDEINDECEDETNDEKPVLISHIDDKPDISEYTKMLKAQGYLKDEVEDAGEDEDEDEGGEEMNKPVVISPEEYGEIDDYDLYSYVYYADHILADECNEPIENVDEIVGEESLNHFGDYGDDSVYVRNDERKAYYEILLDEAKYSELFPREEEE